MSAREWKPGDVAMVPGVGPAIYGRDGQWVTTEGRSRNFINARPLVVIDPEDREQVERLSAALTNAAEWTRACQPQRTEALTVALRSLVTPPKPDEPTGLGAVVEDDAGIVWVLAPKNGRGDTEWVSEHSTGGTWDHIDAVKVLSEGVTP